MRQLRTNVASRHRALFAAATLVFAGCSDNPTPTGVERLLPRSAEPRFVTVGATPAISHYVVNAGAGTQTDPHISGSLIAYTDESTTGIASRVRHHDLATGADAIVPQTGEFDFLPDISGTRITFTRFTSTESAIYLYDVSGASPPTRVAPEAGSNRVGSAIGGNTVAFVDQGLTADPAATEILVTDVGTSTTIRLTTDASQDVAPAVSPDGNVIVWIKCDVTGTNCDVWKAVRSADGWTAAAVTGLEGEETAADTDGQIITYDSIRSDGDRDIYWQPAAGGAEQRLALTGNQRNPAVSAGVITFESNAAGNFHIWAYDAATDVAFAVTTATADETLTDVSVSSDGVVQVAYTSFNGTDFDVHALSFQRPTAELYAFAGFFPPVENSPAVNKARAGSAVPVKFSLGGDQGLDIFAAGHPLTKAATCELTASDVIEETVTAGASTLSYDPVTTQYTYVWKTDKVWAGTCRQLVVGLKDGTTHTAWFSFVR